MKKRLLSALLSGALLGTLFLGGCGSGETQTQNSTETAASTAVSESEGKTYRGNDVSEPVTIKMYLIGDRTPDFDLVYEEVNKKLEETVNATVEVEFLSWAEHDTKYSLLFSSGEDFDLIFTATGWAHYSETANMGGFYELTPEFISTYAPDIQAVAPEDAWEQAPNRRKNLYGALL